MNEVIDHLDNSILNKIIQSPLFLSFRENKLTYRNFNKLVEKAGKCFGFSEDIIYNIRTYNKGLFNELLRTSSICKENIIKKVKAKNFMKVIDRREIVRFFYNEIKVENYDNFVKFLPLFFDEFLITLYIYTVKGRKKAY